MSSSERRKEVARVRQEAQEAARAGKPIHSCPYRYANEQQWKDTYRAEVERIELETALCGKLDLEERINICTDVDDVKALLRYLLDEGYIVKKED